MKSIGISFALFFIVTASTFAQESKYSLGLGVSPLWDGVSTSIYLNRYIGNRWLFGIMPTYRYYQYSTQQRDFYGINLNTRFFFITEQRFEPYAYAFGGYIRSKFRNEDQKPGTDNLDLSLGLGTQYRIGKSGWSIDLNIGYLWFRQIHGIEKFRSPFYSFGVNKRIGKSK